LEREMEMLCVKGVEDRIKDRVSKKLELMSNDGIKIWMLKGDKMEKEN
jgi:phospholipid-translocating ATPase